MTATEIDLALEVDIDKPLVCEVRWYNEQTKESHPCEKTAQWVGLCHDEVTSHDYQQTLFCGKCYMMAALKQYCPDDWQKLIIKAKRL